jgi:hypothetical protein
MTLERLVIEMKSSETVIRVLYKCQDGPNSGTKARRKEVTELARRGLTRALESLEDGAECVGASGFTTREDVLSAMASPSPVQQAKGA